MTRAIQFIVNNLAKLFEKYFCWDITENFKKDQNEFKELTEASENLKHRIFEYQIKHLLRSGYSTDKNTRIMLVLTFVILIATLLMLIATLVLLFR